MNILGFLRSKGIVHRDLKPGNFLFNETWHLLLADFGTAKEIKEQDGLSPINKTSLQKAFSSFSSGLTSQNSANNLMKSSVSTSS